MTAEKLESPLDPLLAALSHFHSSADLSNKACDRCVCARMPAYESAYLCGYVQ